MDDAELSQSNVVSTRNGATIVINGTNGAAAIFSLAGLTDVEKADFATVTDKFDNISTTSANFISDTPVHLVPIDSGKGLVLSVTDSVVGGVSYGNLSNPSDITATTQLLHHGALVDSTHPQLFEVQTETVTNPSLGGAGVDLHLSTNHTVPAAPLEEEPKKRKGGWPKGKKRKKDTKESGAPRAPMTGYVIYAIERRLQIKESNPEIPFAEVTKILGNEWSSMSHEEKQKYLQNAEADKKRYVEELKAYQQSQAYQHFLKKKKIKGLGVDPTSLDTADIDQSLLTDLGDDELYCKVCNQYFSSGHNKKEHMFGKQHLQMITGEFEKELQQQQENDSSQDAHDLVTSDLHGDLLTHGSEDQSILCSPRSSGASVDIESFIQGFIEKHLEREQEIRELHKSVAQAKDLNQQLLKQAQEFKALQMKLEQDFSSLLAYGAAHSAQIDGLKMVPTLFGVINF